MITDAHMPECILQTPVRQLAPLMPSRNSLSNQLKIDLAWQNTELGLLLEFIFGKTKELYVSTLQTINVVVGLVYK